MTDMELYEATREYWKVSPDQAKNIDYVLSVYDGMVLEAYEAVDWYPAHTTLMERVDTRTNEEVSDRYEFIGRIAANKIRKKYVNKSVSSLFKAGNANPIKYIWGKK